MPSASSTFGNCPLRINYHHRSTRSDMSSKPVIAVVGSLNVDLVTRTSRVPNAGETINATSFSLGFGGKGGNQASACGRLSRPKQDPGKSVAEILMIGAIGDDQFANGMLDSLTTDGVDVSGIRTVKGQSTGSSIILVEEDSGENRILFVAGANGTFAEDEDLVPHTADVALFQLETPLQTVLHNVRVSRNRGTQVILNPAPAVPLPASIFPSISHLIVNASEALLLSTSLEDPVDATIKTLSDLDTLSQQQLDTLALPLLDAGAENLIITLGSKGVYYHTLLRYSSGQQGRMVAATKVAKVIDTTGAGDAFVGAYAVKVAEGLSKRALEEVDREGGGWVSKGVSIDDAVAWAVKVAGKSVERPGARGGVPWADEVGN